MLSVSLSKRRSELVKEVKEVVVRWCSERYNFVASEALEEMGDLCGGVSVSVSKEKSKFVLPYNGEHNEECCNGLRKNVGLYTQCQVKKKVNEKYCKTCQNSAEKNDGVPEYGTIEGRLAVEINEYVDPKGRKPTSYTKIMKKLNLSKEDVLAEGKRLNIVINEKHFEEEEVKVTDVKRGRPKVEKAAKEPKGAKGRPKKTKKVVEVNGDDEPEDLFASLCFKSLTEEGSVNVEEEVVEEVVEVKKTKKAEATRLKEEKEATRLKEKEEKEAKKKATEEAKAQRIKEKEAAKAKKSETQKAKEQEQEQVVEEEEQDIVKKIEVNGVKYLKSKKTGIIYDYNSYTEFGVQVILGQWNDEKKIIKFDILQDEDEEECD